MDASAFPSYDATVGGDGGIGDSGGGCDVGDSGGGGDVGGCGADA